jgi:hypothetical protein
MRTSLLLAVLFTGALGCRNRSAPTDGDNAPAGPLAGGPALVLRPKGYNFDALGQPREAPEVVDRAWAQLRGKWQMLPNPKARAVYEFGDDYTVTWRHTPSEGQEHRVKRTVVGIKDRGAISRITHATWLTGGPGDHFYDLDSEPHGGVDEGAGVTVFANGTMSAQVFEERFYRVGAASGGERMRSLEETLWILLAGRRWVAEFYNWEETIEFRADKTLYWKRVIDRKDGTVVEGKITALRATDTGFWVRLGAHVFNGRSVTSGELGEFYYLGKYLYVRPKGTSGEYQLSPKAMDQRSSPRD